MYSRAQAWYDQRTWHWRDWPAEALPVLMAAELLIVAERRRSRPGGSVPASPRLQQLVREGAQVRPVARAIPVLERPAMAARLSSKQPSRAGGRP